jgi:hypothetical protein
MRHLTSRLLSLLLLTGLLVFFSAPKSEAVVRLTCQQDCYNLYRACLSQGQGDFFWCCAAYNDCIAENCGGGPTCELPQYPPQ